jgi:glycosyltransferase involved in cell wall biosynthesis
MAHLQDLRFFVAHPKKLEPQTRKARNKASIMHEVTILQVVPRLDAGGSELSTVEIAEALVRAGANALVATEGGRMAHAISHAGGKLIELPVASKNPLTMLANAVRLARLIKERNVSLVHARSRAPAWSALLASRWTGRPFVTTYHGAYGDTGPLKAAYNSVMLRGDRVIANSLYTADLIVSRQRSTRERLRVIYRGIDSAVFGPAAARPELVERLKTDWGVPKDAKIVLLAGRLTSLKGQRDLIAAAARLAEKRALDGAVVVMAGDAPGRDAYRQELEALIARHGLGDKVRLVGHCQNMPAAFRAAHVTVIASRVPETFGRTSVEAQAMGCPVIVPALGALPETLVAAEGDAAGFTGWLMPPRNVEALADRIGLALTLTPAARATIGARASAHAVTKFELARMQASTLAVYDELLGTDLALRFARQRATL